MPFKHSLSLFSCNLSLAYKMLLFFFIILIIAAALFVSIVQPVVQGVNETLQVQGTEITKDLFMENPIKFINDIWETTSDFLKTNSSFIFWQIFYLFLVLMMTRFFISLIFVPVSRIFYKKMTTGYSLNLFPTFISNFPTTIGFAFFSSTIYGIIDIGLFLFSVECFIWIYKLIRITSLLVALLIFVILYAIRMCLFSQWLPLISSGEKNIFKALCKSFSLSKKGFKTLFPIIFTLIIFYCSLILTTIIPTFALIPVLVFPMFIILVICSYLTIYFNLTRKKYYTDNGNTIYDPNNFSTIE